MSASNEVNSMLDTSTIHPLDMRAAAAAARGAASRTRGRLNVMLASPNRPVRGIRPEELFAAGWSASFLSAIERAATELSIALPSERVVDAEVDLGNPTGGGNFRRVRLSIGLPGLPREVARELVEAANAFCPYWNATRENVEVVVEIG